MMHTSLHVMYTMYYCISHGQQIAYIYNDHITLYVLRYILGEPEYDLISGLELVT